MIFHKRKLVLFIMHLSGICRNRESAVQIPPWFHYFLLGLLLHCKSKFKRPITRINRTHVTQEETVQTLETYNMNAIQFDVISIKYNILNIRLTFSKQRSCSITYCLRSHFLTSLNTFHKKSSISSSPDVDVL